MSHIWRDHQKAYTTTVVMTVMPSYKHIRLKGESVVHVGTSRDNGEGQDRTKELGKGEQKYLNQHCQNYLDLFGLYIDDEVIVFD